MKKLIAAGALTVMVASQAGAFDEDGSAASLFSGPSLFSGLALFAPEPPPSSPSYQPDYQQPPPPLPYWRDPTPSYGDQLRRQQTEIE